jgi:hypothetical protein
VAWPLCVFAAAAPLAAPSTAAAIRPDQAAEHAGSEVTVEGYVERAVCSSKACVLSFGPAFSGLVVSIPDGVGIPLGSVQELYEGRTVRVQGVVTTPQGRPRIEIEDAPAIERVDLAVGVRSSKVTEGTRSGEEATGSASGPTSASATANQDGATVAAAGSGWKVAVQAKPDADGRSVAEIARALEATEGGARPSASEAAPATGELASRVRALEERMGESAALPPGQLPLTDSPVVESRPDDVAGLHEQLATVDAHLVELAETIAFLEQRVAALESLAASAAGASGQAPVVARADSLHRARRGWNADRVLRTFGEPERIIDRGGGSATWHYSGGRSLTIDPRGRVTAAIGF